MICIRYLLFFSFITIWTSGLFEFFYGCSNRRLDVVWVRTIEFSRPIDGSRIAGVRGASGSCANQLYRSESIY